MNSYYHQILEKYNQFKAPGLNVELEIRMIVPYIKVPNIIDLKWETITIPYYRSNQHPSLTIRKIDNKIETKELIEKVNISTNLSINLSIEKEYTRFPDSLFQYLNREIKRTILYNEPYTTLTYHNNTYLLEIEYTDLNTLNKALDIINQFSIPYWPTVKPIDGYTTEIISKLLTKKYYLTPKADGMHCIMYLCNELDWILVFDNGTIHSSASFTSNLDDTILEGEWMENKQFLCFDIIQYKGKYLGELKLMDRLNYVKMYLPFIQLKQFIHIKKYEDLWNGYNRLKSNKEYSTDGWILTPTKYGDIIYKSKQIPTVDLQYIDGYLYLANERTSQREPKYTTYNLENNKIYEFNMEMELIKAREDKIIPNYKMPVEVDPITSMITGEGVPSLRYHHNYIKLRMLELIKNYGGNTLLDIGSGYGGDIKKWKSVGFKHIYAVDPNLNLRQTSNTVTHLRCLLQSIPSIEYDAISLFFVPWNKDFLSYFIKAKCIAIIVMSNPKKLKSSIANVGIENGNINISFPSTVTAENIIEPILNINDIDTYMEQHNYECNNVECPIIWGSSIERKIASMYTYHIYIKK